VIKILLQLRITEKEFPLSSLKSWESEELLMTRLEALALD
jgi:hypothetical protein